MKVSILLIALPFSSVVIHADRLFDHSARLEHHYLSSLQAGPANGTNPASLSRRARSTRCGTAAQAHAAGFSSSSSNKHPKAFDLSPSQTQATRDAGGIVATIEGLVDPPSNCGPIGATEDVTALSGPNGNIDWLNCGITGSGWTPPLIKVSQVIAANLTSAAKSSQSAFSACQQFISLFEQYGKQFDVPAIFLASFAMQESSCNPNAVGGAGEQGLMQLTKDKCTDAPGGNCKDPNYNIMSGAKYFADTLSGNDGNLLLTIGGYNGWPRGLTVGEATAAAKSSCCRCQNNLDYLHQFLNGWAQGINAYSHQPPLGKYFNLNSCPST